jgi:hypothetical protein
MFPAQRSCRFHGNGYVNICSHSNGGVVFVKTKKWAVRLSVPYSVRQADIKQNMREHSCGTVTLRVVGGDEKGSLKSETVKYGLEYQGTQTRERLRWQGPVAYTKERPVLSPERAPDKKQDRNCQTVINIWPWTPTGARHQDLLTDWPSVAMWPWLRLDFNFWMPEPICIKLGMYIMPPKPVSTAYFRRTSHQLMWRFLYPPSRC